MMELWYTNMVRCNYPIINSYQQVIHNFESYPQHIDVYRYEKIESILNTFLHINIHLYVNFDRCRDQRCAIGGLN